MKYVIIVIALLGLVGCNGEGFSPAELTPEQRVRLDQEIRASLHEETIHVEINGGTPETHPSTTSGCALRAYNVSDARNLVRPAPLVCVSSFDMKYLGIAKNKLLRFELDMTGYAPGLNNLEVNIRKFADLRNISVDRVKCRSLDLWFGAFDLTLNGGEYPVDLRNFNFRNTEETGNDTNTETQSNNLLRVSKPALFQEIFKSIDMLLVDFGACSVK